MRGVMMKSRILLAVTLMVSGCSSSGTMSDELDQLRAQIGSEAPATEQPLYRPEFNRFIDDYTPITQDFIYDYIAGRLRVATEDQITDRVEGAFEYAKGLNAPAAYRGKVWKIHGTIEDIEMAHLEGDPRSSGAPLYMGYLLTRDHQPMAFHLTQKPEPLVVGQDSVEVEGVFVKLVRMETRSGQDIVVPFFMAKQLRKFH